MEYKFSKVINDVNEYDEICERIIVLLNKYLLEYSNYHGNEYKEIDIYSNVSKLETEDGLVKICIENVSYEIPFKWIINSDQYWNNLFDNRKSKLICQYETRISELTKELDYLKKELEKVKNE